MTMRRTFLLGLVAASVLATAHHRAIAQTPASPLTREAVILALDRLQADRWYPAGAVPATVATADRQILDAAFASGEPDLRRIAVRGVGRFESPADVARIAPLLDDADTGVRRAAAFAIGQALHKSTGTNVQGASTLLRARFSKETDPAVKDTIAESIARLPYDAATSAQVVADRSLPIGFPGIQRILQRLRTVQITEPVRVTIRQAASPKPPAKPDVRALEILGTIADTGLDPAAVSYAATYTCAAAADPLCGADVRFAALALVDARNDAHKAAMTGALGDPALRVRLQAVRKMKAAAGAGNPWNCAPLLDLTGEKSTAGAGHQIEAITLLDTRCEQRDAVTTRVKAIAGRLADVRENDRWHVPARALETLAGLDAAEAHRMLDEVAAPHVVAWVRAAAARVANTLESEATITKLAADADANVRTEAITLLTRRKFMGLTPLAINALTSPDYQLVLTAATALRGAAPDAKVTAALVTSIARVTTDGKDTSRDPRMEMLRRLREIAQSGPAGASLVASHRAALDRLLVDFDATVAAAAADVVGASTGTRPDPKPARRAPQQPTEAVLRTLPRSAVITMADGSTVNLALFPEDAPLTVARFVTLARSGYFNGLTFHRIAPYFVVQGGSPGANEYAGDARFMRDEIGFERHSVGSVGISTRGRDTGDAQIFIDLIDVHRLDFDYTVFARVRPGTQPPMPGRPLADMAAVTAMQAGARIAKVETK